MKLSSIIFIVWALVFSTRADSFGIATLNAYWFFGQERYENGDSPRNADEYSLKAGHLIGLLPPDAPLFIAFQEIGNDGDIRALANSASARYKRHYAPLFVQGRDTATKQDVGALLDTTRGWGIHGQPARVSDLEKELSKHLVVRLTNALISIDLCVVHLRRPIGSEGQEKQKEQCRALLRWSMRHLAKNPDANLIILGDFNEGEPVGSEAGALSVIFQSKPPMVDALSSVKGRVRTHANGKAYDRILVSNAVTQGKNRLKLSNVEVREHRHGKGEDRRLYTDHFPIIIRLTLQ